MANRTKPHNQQTMFDMNRPATRDSGPVICLGITFSNDEERRKHFLGLLRAGLQELREKLSLPFTSVEDTFNRSKSLQHWPLGADEEVRELAQRIAHAASSTRDSGPATRDILGIYKDEVGFPHAVTRTSWRSVTRPVLHRLPESLGERFHRSPE
jgi:hypothetical protein